MVGRSGERVQTQSLDCFEYKSTQVCSKRYIITPSHNGRTCHVMITPVFVEGNPVWYSK